MIPDRDRVVRIMGIDASTTCTGFAIIDWDRVTQEAKLVATFDSAPEGGCEIERRLYLGRLAGDLVRQYRVRFVSTEEAFTRKNPHVGILLTQLRATIEDACYSAWASVESVTTGQVKAALGLRNGDDKKVVGPAIIMERFGVKCGPDAADAVGAALALGPKLVQREAAA